MARLVTKFKYLKPNRKVSAGGYAKYISTRDSVEKIDDTKKFAPATVKQKNLIEKILKDFPDSKDMFEYADYLKKQNQGTASDFISRFMEDYAYEISGRKTYANYIATRPRAEKFGSHGLFTDDGIQVQLSKVTEELDKHKGNIWTAIISIRREDAQRLGFNTGTRWRDMLRTQTEALAKNLKIPMENLRWYAAFHNETHHPHVHLIAYSTVENEGYLTQKGVENLRSSFAKDIFQQDLLCIYEKQTEHRDKLRAEAKDIVEDLVANINCEIYVSASIQHKLLELADRLSKTKGKKVYGYLKTDVKALIDSIVEELASDDRIKKLYDLWYEQKENIIRTYTDEISDRIPLAQNKEFKSIKNAVIKKALKLIPNEDKIEESENADEEPVSNLFEYEENTSVESVFDSAMFCILIIQLKLIETVLQFPLFIYCVTSAI